MSIFQARIRFLLQYLFNPLFAGVEVNGDVLEVYWRANRDLPPLEYEGFKVIVTYSGQYDPI